MDDVDGFEALKAEWGQRLRDRRHAAGLTLAVLAERADTTRGAISRMETGKSGGHTRSRIAIAEALGVDVEDIWTYTTPDRKEPLG